MKKAVVLGGTHDHITVIDLLKKRGYFTILIDYHNNPVAREYADCFIRESTTDKEKVLEIANKHNVTLVVSACVESALATMVYVSTKLDLPCHINYETVLSVTNKTLMKDVFINNGIPTSKHITVDKDNLDNVKQLKLPLVIKPADANSSKGIQKIHSYDECCDAYSNAVKYSKSKQVIAEEFIEGKELSVDVAVVNGKHNIVLITETIKSETETSVFTISESRYPVKLLTSELNQLNDIIKKIVKAYKLRNTPLLVQVLHSGQEFVVIECSARIGGGSKHHLIKKITDCNVISFFLDMLEKRTINDISLTKHYSHASLKYIYSEPGVITNINTLEKEKHDKVIDEVFFIKPKG